MTVLYHGTSRTNRSRIRREGFRKYTWFSTDLDDAKDFGEVSADPRGRVDVWQITVSEKDVRDLFWHLGSKRGTFYKSHHKIHVTPVLIESYPWDVELDARRPGKVL